MDQYVSCERAREPDATQVICKTEEVVLDPMEHAQHLGLQRMFLPKSQALETISFADSPLRFGWRDCAYAEGCRMHNVDLRLVNRP